MPISRAGGKQDYLVTVPCYWQDVNGTIGYFYNTVYKLQPGDTFANISKQIYTGEAWKVGGEERSYIVGEEVTIHLLCGCGEKADSQPVVTYTVQEYDTLPVIAKTFSSKVGDIVKLNPYLGQLPQFLDVGWLLYVPMERSWSLICQIHGIWCHFLWEFSHILLVIYGKSFYHYWSSKLCLDISLSYYIPETKLTNDQIVLFSYIGSIIGFNLRIKRKEKR